MSTPVLSQIWSLSVPLTGELPRAPKFDIWVVNAIFLARVVVNSIAVQLNAIPGSETRLRNEGMAPFYSFYASFCLSTLEHNRVIICAISCDEAQPSRPDHSRATRVIPHQLRIRYDAAVFY